MNTTTPLLDDYWLRIRCYICGSLRPRNEFARKKKGRPVCRNCVTSRSLAVKTGASLDWKALKWAMQNGNCAACHEPIPNLRQREGEEHAECACVEHSNSNGINHPHAVVHWRCNLAIAHAKHSPNVLHNLADYCEATRAT